MNAVCRNGVSRALKALHLTEAGAQEHMEAVRKNVIAYVNNRAERAFKSHMDHIINRVMIVAVSHYLAASGDPANVNGMRIIMLHGDYVDRGGLHCHVPTFPSARLKDALAQLSAEVSPMLHTHTNTHSHTTHTQAFIITEFLTSSVCPGYVLCSFSPSSLSLSHTHTHTQSLSLVYTHTNIHTHRCDRICSRPVSSNKRYRHFCMRCFNPAVKSDVKGHSKDITGTGLLTGVGLVALMCPETTQLILYHCRRHQHSATILVCASSRDGPCFPPDPDGHWLRSLQEGRGTRSRAAEY